MVDVFDVEGNGFDDVFVDQFECFVKFGFCYFNVGFGDVGFVEFVVKVGNGVVVFGVYGFEDWCYFFNEVGNICF